MSWRLKRLRLALSIQIARAMLKILSRVFTPEHAAQLPDLKCLWLGELRNMLASAQGAPTITYQGGSRRCPTGICKGPLNDYDAGLLFLSGRHCKPGYSPRAWRQCRIALLARQQMALPPNDDLLMHDSLEAVRNHIRKLCGVIRNFAHGARVTAADIDKLELAVTAINAEIRLIIESFELENDFLGYMK